MLSPLTFLPAHTFLVDLLGLYGAVAGPDRVNICVVMTGTTPPCLDDGNSGPPFNCPIIWWAASRKTSVNTTEITVPCVS